jgi:hypothetical protein
MYARFPAPEVRLNQADPLPAAAALAQPAMSVVGQSRRFGDVRVASALPPRTDILRKGRHVSKVPEAIIPCICVSAKLPG